MDERQKVVLGFAALGALGVFLLVRRASKRGVAGSLVDVALGSDIRDRGLIGTGRDLVSGPEAPPPAPTPILPVPEFVPGPFIPSRAPGATPEERGAPIDVFPDDGSLGLISGPLTSPVVAALVDPTPTKRGKRSAVGSTFGAELRVKNYTLVAQNVQVEVHLRTTKFVLFGDGSTETRQLIGFKLKPQEQVSKRLTLDTNSNFDVGDVDVVATVRANGRITQTMSFSVQ